MQKSGIVTKINMPSPIVQLCAVVLVGIGVTSTALGAGFRDGGTESFYTCQDPGPTMVGWDTTDWSVPVSGYTGQSDLASDDPIPNCKTTTTIEYYSKPNGGVVTGAGKRNTCSACNTGYHLVSHTMPSQRQRDCIVTWEECVKDTPCDGLACEGRTSWMNVSGQNYQTRCNTSTNKCEYQCKSNYYSAGGVAMFGSPPNCKACPDHTMDGCPAGTIMPCCDVGYYLIDHNYAEAGGGIVVTRPKDYECLRCPSIGIGLPLVYGTTRLECPVNAPTPSHITRCYIPPNTSIRMTEGTFQFTQQCNYTEDE